jgi:hypothetical protein
MQTVLARHEVEVLTAYRGLRAACSRDNRALVTKLTIDRLIKTTRAMYVNKANSRASKRVVELVTAYRAHRGVDPVAHGPDSDPFPQQ